MKLEGSICALVTPFTAAGALDLPAFASLVDWHARSGTSAVVVGGSTGESGALEEAEVEQLLGVALAGARHMAVVAGCGAASTDKAMRLVQRAQRAGAAAALVVTPYYVRPTQEGLYRHYAALAEHGGLPVIAYNVPSRTGCDLLPETLARLAPLQRIVAIKEARADAERMDALLALKSPTFAVLSGDDPTATRALRAGADGVISVASNVCPATFARLCGLARGAHAEAAALDAELQPLYRVLGAEPNPIPVKWLLQRMGRIGPALRLPLVEMSEGLHAEADACVQRIERIERNVIGAQPTANVA